MSGETRIRRLSRVQGREARQARLFGNRDPMAVAVTGGSVNYRCFSLRAAVGALALSAAMAAPAWAQGASIAQGPMIGAVSFNTATVWVRLTAQGSVRVRYAIAKGGDWSYTGPVA